MHTVVQAYQHVPNTYSLQNVPYVVTWATANLAVALKEALGKGSAEVQGNRRLTLGRLASQRVNVSGRGAHVLVVVIGFGLGLGLGLGFARHHGM